MEHTFALRDRTAIAGIGATEFSRDSGRSEVALAAEACLAAVADAGLDLDDIDGIVRCDMDHVTHNAIAQALGLRRLGYWGEVGPGGSAPCGMIGQAAAAVVAGLATNVVVYRSLNGRSGDRYGRGRLPDVAGGDGSYDEFFAPYGYLTPAQMYAMLAQRHIEVHGTTPEQLGAIAIAVRANAARNPAAQMFGRPLDLDTYLGARMIASPLRLYDCCLESDGAVAVVVTATERARDLPHPPALIRSVAQSTMPGIQGGMMWPSLMRPDVLDTPAHHAAPLLYARAGLGPGDIDVAQIYDCFTITVLLQLEAYGFCAIGEGGPFAASGALSSDGELPINTAGGNLSEAYIHGLNHVVEGVRQIRGTSTNQVSGAETCLVTSGIPPATSALILRSDR